MKKTVSIIVLNFNGVNFLKKCLPTIFRQTYPHIETIVVDNNSTDESLKYLDTVKNIQVIKNKKNLGYAEANNKAAQKATGEFVLFLNNDTELFPDLIQKLVDSYKDKSLIAPAQIPTWNKKIKGFAGGGMDIFGYPYTMDDGSTKVSYVDGAAFFMKRNDFISIGMFDEKLFIFQEDIDLSWRAQLYGYRIISCWDAKLYHYSGGTVLGGGKKEVRYASSYFRRYLNEKNVVRNILKNYSTFFLIVILPTLLALHAFELIFLLLMGKIKVVQCYINAYVWNIRNIKDTLQFRKKIQEGRVVSDKIFFRRMYFAYSKLTAFKNVGLPEFR